MSAADEVSSSHVDDVLGCCDLEELEDLLAHGAPEAVTAAIDDYGHAIGRGLESLVIAYGPDRVVLCGRASRFLPHFSHGLRAELERSPDFRHDLDVVESSLGDLAGAIGASVMVELRGPLTHPCQSEVVTLLPKRKTPGSRPRPRASSTLSN